ncbi:PLP-dependent aspartate aminotransferase family protein [Pseudomonas sp. 10S4]|uniref:trans-sulfuration enzyme family protein n=1 Tax=Pseudomonas sp. 10S4 TaxID=3048583 RepID=UPI002AC8CDEC|nr:PLP-dependent aspartate aminotransferase family protein [Pseudomonas sp. 10S4]WPX20721.1 PLP-dependent aspartate aminotransferase family protein [Pseudomonas sp. 10S4]
MTNKIDHAQQVAPETRLIEAGRRNWMKMGFVNPPVYRGSTVLFDSYSEMAPGAAPYHYGRWATPTTDAFCEAMAEIEYGVGALAMCSGLGAITTTLIALARPGSRVLVAQSSYAATRKFCEQMLSPLGIEVEYFSLDLLSELRQTLTDNVSLIYLDLPGSVTFDVCNLRELTAYAGRVPVVVDNTWATPYFFNPLKHGASVVIHSTSKYISGHSDSVMGAAVFADVPTFERTRDTARLLGQAVGADDANLALRGLRTLAVRMNRHYESASRICAWLSKHPAVESVFYPALPSDRNHAAWKAQFSGAGGVFTFTLKGGHTDALQRFIDRVSVIGRGWGWGVRIGYLPRDAHGPRGRSSNGPAHERRIRGCGYAPYRSRHCT